MTKAPTPTEKSKKQCVNTKTRTTKNFDYTTIADRLRTVSWIKTATQLVWLNRLTGSQPSRGIDSRYGTLLSDTPSFGYNSPLNQKLVFC